MNGTMTTGFVYRQGEEREVPEQLQRRFEYAMDLCKCSDFEKKYMQPFIAFGFDTLQIGKIFETSSVDVHAKNRTLDLFRHFY